MYLPIRRYKNSTFILQYPQYMITTNGDKVVETKEIRDNFYLPDLIFEAKYLRKNKVFEISRN